MKKHIILMALAIMALGLSAQEITPQEREALNILYESMPLPDKAAHDEAFYLQHVRNVLRAREEMPWGKIVPEREFRYFVLPVRVNNEPLSPYNGIIYDELKDRVKGLSMKDAILEVNHWCHEKVTYQPSDSRTHSPLESMSSSIGRCGEESTFTVSALRSVGIPARQVYTPRWAHTDDNHAWVEAWADGQWYFLGACEPEAVLNLGWFNAPASRAMLMNTKVVGAYDGPEEVLNNLGGYTEINVTETYAPLKTTKVRVVNKDGRPVEGANVCFRLYNYAEYYPLSTKVTNADGIAELTSGVGSMMLWADDKNGNFGFAHCPGSTEDVTVVIGDNPDGIYEYHLVPPAPGKKTVMVSDAQAQENERRKAEEDAIRAAYMATFVNPSQAAEIASELGLPADRVVKIFTLARGNHQTIYNFLTNLAPDRRMAGLMLLEALCDKDLSDVLPEVLAENAPAVATEDLDYIKYVLNPRVAYEFLRPYRKRISQVFDASEATEMRANPRKWMEWVDHNINASAGWQPSTVIMNPADVMETRFTNHASRDVFFVAGARTLGIPARMDLVRSVPQWRDENGRWHDAEFFNDAVDAGLKRPGKGTLTLTYEPTRILPDPGYYYNFSVSKITDGQPVLLEYDDDATWSGIFRDGAELESGKYILTTGQRMADGSVLARSVIFNIEDNQDVTLPLIIRNDDSGVKVIGSFNSEDIYHDRDLDKNKSLLSTTGRGYYILVYANPNHEPTNHALRDICLLSQEFEEYGRPVMLIFPDEGQMARFREEELPKLPAVFHIGADVDGKIAAELSDGLYLDVMDAPVVIIADTFNRVVFESQGYSIGLGRRIMDTLLKLDK